MVGLLERIEAAEIAQADVMAQKHEDKMLARSRYYTVLMWVFRFVTVMVGVIGSTYSNTDSFDAVPWAALVFSCYAVFYVIYEKSKHVKTIQRYRLKLDEITDMLPMSVAEHKQKENYL